MRTKIGGSGYQRLSVAINVAGEDYRAIANCRAANHYAA
jgi:hypothetical protein